MIATPSHDGKIAGEIVSAVIDAMVDLSKSGDKCGYLFQQYSLLTRNFNLLLSETINKGDYTHFCMVHADIFPFEEGWLSKMLGIMEESGAELLSVVSPIKNFQGVTSTGLSPREELPLNVKRLTLKEIWKMPETWTDPQIVVNTGLMLIDLRAPWIGKAWFGVKDDVIKDEDGKYRPVALTEDWLFSLRVRELGGKIFATRGVKLKHIGSHNFTNFEQYGKDTDGWRQA